MELSEIKVIWDTQNQEPLYGVNEAALHSVIQRRNHETNRCLARCFATEITVGLFCFVLMIVYAAVLAAGGQGWLVKPWGKLVAPSSWDYLGLLAAAAIWFYYAAYMLGARKRQQRQVEVFDSTLRGDLDRALSQTEFQIKMIRDNAWRGLAPIWLAAIIWMIVLFHLKGAASWVYLLMIGVSIIALGVVIWKKEALIRGRFLPRQQELESLRAKLTDAAR